MISFFFSFSIISKSLIQRRNKTERYNILCIDRRFISFTRDINSLRSSIPVVQAKTINGRKFRWQ